MTAGQILYDLLMRHSIECFGHVYNTQEDSMWICSVKIKMNVMQQFDEIVGYRGILEPTTLNWIKERIYHWEQPVTNE